MEWVCLWHVARFRTTSRPRKWAARQLQGLVTVVEPLALRNLLLGQLWARILEVVVAQGAVILGLLQQLLHQRRDLRAVRVLAKWTAIAAIFVLAAEFMALEQVVESRVVLLAVYLHLFVRSLRVERRLMQTIFEVVSILLDLLSVHGAAFGISANLKALLANLRKHHTNLLPLIEHSLLVGVEPRVPLLRVVKILGCARVWIAQVVRNVVLASQCSVVAALDRDGF
mmetsp:Transcript_37070/g.50778  ORF Transcript_37070/g.50778 Transcript_37070/m.50778 type:complete len:227 (+) Transcript_37070:559-1239(+)